MPRANPLGSNNLAQRRTGGLTQHRRDRSRRDGWPRIGATAELVSSDAGPPFAAEIVVGLKKRGYRSGNDRHVLLRSLREPFMPKLGRVERGDDARWGVL